MNILICAAIIGIIGLINYRLSKKILHPAVIFSGYWSLLLLLLVILPNDYYATSNKTLLIFSVGVLCFSCGSWLSLYVFNKQPHYQQAKLTFPEEPFRHCITRVLLCVLALSILLLPYYCYHLYQLSIVYQRDYYHLNPFSSFFIGLRQAVVHDDGLGPFKYLTTWFSFLCLIALIEYRHYQTRKNKLLVIGFFIIVVCYYLLSTARIGLVSFLLSFFTLYIMLANKLKIKGIILGGLALVCAFIIPAIVMHKGMQVNTSPSPTDHFLLLLKNIELYLLGSIPAFNLLVIFPPLSKIFYFPQDYSISFFLKVGHLFNSDIAIPERIFPYLYIPAPTNVYSIFLPSYLDFGWAGTIPFFSSLGFITATCFHYAIRQKAVALVLYSSIVAGLLLSNFFDAFLVGLSFWIQLFTITFLIYKIPSLVNSYHIRTTTLLNKS